MHPPERVGARSDWELVAAGRWTSCGIAGGVAHCWGLNSEGQAGQPDTRLVLAPTPIPHDTAWVTLSLSHSGTCGIDDRAELWCWGLVKGGLVPEPIDPLYSPAHVPGSWRRVAVGFRHSCAITTEGALWCWGSNDRGELATTVPPDVRGLGMTPSGPRSFTWSDVAVGDLLTCATRTDGELFCWGSDDDCRIGGGGDTATVRHICLPR